MRFVLLHQIHGSRRRRRCNRRCRRRCHRRRCRRRRRRRRCHRHRCRPRRPCRCARIKGLVTGSVTANISWYVVSEKWHNFWELP